MIDKMKEGQIVNIQAYKHSGLLYRQWNGAKVIEVSDQDVVLLVYKTKVIEEKQQKWTVREPMLWWLSKEKWHNTTGLIRSSGTYFYTNLASPFIYEEGTIKYIDYDLDVKAYPEKPIKIVDRREFEENKIEMKYPEKLIHIIENETKIIVKLINSGDSYFDEEVIAQWVEELVNKNYISEKFIK
ncbi:DUF402 domain-containing protein [Candidatus Mycoplasma mahonii]|uniref:DUF402 domain-containing protein n=1 Tax=Candidatus Mycoplasma mahonii TaxID=3004105 RepID=UPI0026F37609|nr:DUF402 domain-containing protein [Candidatus Mycoplasma mahonii]WKX02578.1 DUF402 domain-containing protein [Candidatus Mycoplasma mahonii]